MAGWLSECNFVDEVPPTVAEDAIRRAADALGVGVAGMPDLGIKLHAKQVRALETGATELLFGGAAGGGKSYLLRAAAIYWCNIVPGLQAYLFRRTSDDLWKNHMDGPGAFPDMLAAWIGTGYAKINHSRGQIQLGNGSTIHLCHCQYEKDKFKYQGAEIHMLLIDELTHFTRSIYAYLRGRVRTGSLRVPKWAQGKLPRIINGSNPGGIGHNWVKSGWVDNAPEGRVVKMPPSEGGMLRQFVRSLLQDNPTMEANDPEYRDRLEGLGNPALVKAMKSGDWDIVAGGMFDDVWDRSRHVVQPFPVPAGWFVFRAFDWGSSKPFSVGWWARTDGTPAVYPDGRELHLPKDSLVRIGEWYGWNGNANEGCRMLAAEIARGILENEARLGVHVNPGPSDSRITDESEGQSIRDKMATAGVAWVIAKMGPGSRRNGWESVRSLLKAALQCPIEEPCMLIFETCRHFIRTVPTLPRDPRNEDDVDTNAEDHIGDETRYAASWERQYVGTVEVAV